MGVFAAIPGLDAAARDLIGRGARSVHLTAAIAATNSHKQQCRVPATGDVHEVHDFRGVRHTRQGDPCTEEQARDNGNQTVDGSAAQHVAGEFGHR